MLYPEYGDFEEQTGALIKVSVSVEAAVTRLTTWLLTWCNKSSMVISWAKVQLIAKSTVKSYSMR